MVIKVTSFKIEEDIIKQIKIKAIEKDITQTELITEYLKQGLINDGVIIE